MLRLPFLILFALLLFAACEKDDGGTDMGCTTDTLPPPPPPPDDTVKTKIFKGVSFVNPPNPVGPESYDPILDVNANWTSLIPFGFISSNSSNVQFDVSWQWWGEKTEGMTDLINFAHSKDMKIMVKPQVWIPGQFTGTFNLTNESEWQELEDTYFDYIMHFAHLAEQLDCEAFCIGTEWKNFVVTRPALWGMLIDSVRANYSGYLTYAGNWDSYELFPHWQKLDFIGIDAYFPLDPSLTPTVDQCVAGWAPHYNAIKDFQATIGIPVIFTEYGYRSIDYCANEPWDSGTSGPVNEEGQANAYRGLYQTFWEEDWFQGGFLWKWFPLHSSAGGANDDRFTPQNKLAEEVVRERYGM